MAAEAGGDVRAGIGTRLKAAREKKGLTVLQAAEKLHVDGKIIEALEAEDFAALGATVYVRGHLRHYAELVDEKAAELQELYTNSTRAVPVQPDLTRISRALPESESSKLAGPAVTVLVAVALLGSVWWLMTLSTDKPQPTAVGERIESNSAAVGKPAAAESGALASQGESSTEAGKVAKAEAPAPAPAGPSRSAPGVIVSTASSARVAAAKTTAGAAPPTPPNATTAATASRPTTSPGSAPAAPTAPPTSHPKESELTLKFSSDSWAEVYDASGRVLFYDVGAASSAHTVRGPAPMRVVLGNAPGVALEFNGRPAPVPGGVQPNGYVRFVINAHGRAASVTDGD